MIEIYKITIAPDAPRLRLTDPMQYGPTFLQFDGREKGHLSPNRAFEMIADPCDRVRQFYNLAAGVLAGPVAGLCECSDMYYATGGNERLSVIVGDTPFTAVNPIDFIPAPKDGSAPCLVDKFYAPIFRIKGRDPLDLFCVSGFGVPMDEFKHVYDFYGFSGLIFEEIWRGAVP